MTKVSDIKKEIGMLHKVFTVKEDTHGEEIRELLRRFEQLGPVSTEEDHARAKAVTHDLIEKGEIPAYASRERK